MIIYLLIICACTFIYLGLTLGYIPPILLLDAFILITPIFLITVTIDQVIATRHPLNRRIQKSVHAWEREIGKPLKKKHLIINLSEEPLANNLGTQLTSKLSIRYSDCQITGYFSHDSSLYLSLYHPTNLMQQLAKLWEEICKTQMKFESLCICLHPDQLPNLKQKLRNEWQLFAHIMQTSSQVSLIINHEHMSKAAYYAAEYGDTPIKLTIPQDQRTLNVFHHLNAQLNIIARQAFHKRHELCSFPPISPLQKQAIFKLPHYIAQQKNHLLIASVDLLSLQIPLQQLSFWFNASQQQNKSFNLALLHQVLSKMVLPLSISAICLMLLNLSFERSVNKALLHLSEGAKVAYLQKLDGYKQYTSLQSEHLEKLKQHYLSKHAPTDANLYNSLLHYTQDSPDIRQWTIDQITQSTLPSDAIPFLSNKWKVKKPQQVEIPLSSVALLIPRDYITPVCNWLYVNNPQCANTMENIADYYDVEKQLSAIEETLLPLNHLHSEQSIRQLTFLTKHTEHIGEKASQELKVLINELESKQQKGLVDRAKEVLSIIDMLKSHQGAYILNMLQKTFVMLNGIKSNADAHLLLKTAYLMEEHPLRVLANIADQLPSHQSTWLHNILKPITGSLNHMNQAHLASIWNKDVLPSVEKISTLYPFSKASDIETKPQQLYQLFGSGQSIDHFYEQYILDFVDEDDILKLKPYELGVEIPQHVLLTVLYAKILQGCLDIKPDHLHASWAVTLPQHTHPTDKVTCFSANQNTPLDPKHSKALHWDSRYPIGMDIQLKNGETITISQDSEWSILHFIEKLEDKGNHTYQYRHTDNAWHIDLKLAPQHAIDLLSIDLFQTIPLEKWVYQQQ